MRSRSRLRLAPLLSLLPLLGTRPARAEIQQVTVDDGGDEPTTQLEYYPPETSLAWTNDTNVDGMVSGTKHTTYMPGAGVTLRFNGTGITYVGTTNADHNEFSVILDGEVATSNGTSGSFVTNVTSFARFSLNQSVPHVLTVLNAEDASKPIDIDAFLIQKDTDQALPAAGYGALPAPPAGGCAQNSSVDDAGGRVQFWPGSDAAVQAWQATTGNSSYANSTVHTSLVDGAGATVVFNGSAIYYVGSRNVDHGAFVAVLDGAISPVQGSFWTSQQLKQVLWSATGLDETVTHTLTIVAIGSGNWAAQNHLDVDEFVVTATQATCGGQSSAAAPRAGWRSRWAALAAAGAVAWLAGLR